MYSQACVSQVHEYCQGCVMSDRMFNAAVKARKLRKQCLLHIKKHNISFNELEILFLIMRKEDITPAKISRDLYIEPAIVSRKLKILSDKRMVQYKQNKKDRRVVNLSISEKGKRLVNSILTSINNESDS